MITQEYPKIETLYNRGPDFKVNIKELRRPEFRLVKWWIVTEKVDGMNIRIALHGDGSVEYAGRTDAAQLPPHLSAYLQATFTPEKMQGAFERNADGTWPEVVVFGEGYGEKIQNGGRYRRGVAVRIFDVLVGRWWLDWSNVEDVALKLGVATVPQLGPFDFFPISEDDMRLMLNHGAARHGNSSVAKLESGQEVEAEGIVARTDPLLLMRDGTRMMWKLKFSDFRRGRR